VAHFEAGLGAHHSELEHLCDGRYILVSHQPMSCGGWITTHEDVTERQQAAAQIVHMARHDALTGLANRTLFLERVQEAASLEGACFAILIIDLDEFKAVNDTFGHPVGDALLAAVSARLCAAIGPEDVSARLGGDEFAVLLRLREADGAPASALAARLLASIRQRYHIEGRDLKIGLSIGIAATTGEPTEPSTIMRQADLALYRAKADGRNCARLFDPAMAEEIQARRELAVALDAALVKGQLAVHYQPIVDAITGDTIAMEALARWRHPLRGNIAPDLFIPLAEEAGLIGRLGACVLEAACRDALSWPTSVKVSVNVSATQVTRNSLVGAVRQALAKTGLPAERLQIEITESVLLGDDDHNLGVLQELRDAGVTIVLDDFGTGFSSLGYLNRFPVDKIKIDRSFVARLGSDAGSAAIVAAVTSIACAFQAVTTAEGVETDEQYRLLRATAVAEMQGFLFGAPLPAHVWTFQGLKAVSASVHPAGAVAA
jgi:diguanylate cyclase (GGDEF)-like protein